MQPRNALKRFSKELLIPHLWPPVILPFSISLLSVNLIALPDLTFYWQQSPSSPAVLELRAGAGREPRGQKPVLVTLARAVPAATVQGCGGLMAALFSGPLPHMAAPRWALSPASHRKSHCFPRKEQFSLFPWWGIWCIYPSAGFQPQAGLSESHHRARSLRCGGRGSCLPRGVNPLFASALNPCGPIFLTSHSCLCKPA